MGSLDTSIQSRYRQTDFKTVPFYKYTDRLIGSHVHIEIIWHEKGKIQFSSVPLHLKSRNTYFQVTLYKKSFFTIVNCINRILMFTNTFVLIQFWHAPINFRKRVFAICYNIYFDLIRNTLKISFRIASIALGSYSAIFCGYFREFSRYLETS